MDSRGIDSVQTKISTWENIYVQFLGRCSIERLTKQYLECLKTEKYELLIFLDKEFERRDLLVKVLEIDKIKIEIKL